MKNSLIIFGISLCLILCGCDATKKVPSKPKVTTVKFQEGPPLYNLLEQSKNNKKIRIWDNQEAVWAVAYDFFVPGYKTESVISLRLWKSIPVKMNEFE